MGGTSTGAIIAAGLSIEITSAELLQFHREPGVSMFEKSALLERTTATPSSRRDTQPVNGFALADQLQSVCEVQRSHPTRLQPVNSALATGARQHGGARFLSAQNFELGPQRSQQDLRLCRWGA